jgi:hypothetical protein
MNDGLDDGVTDAAHALCEECGYRTEVEWHPDCT